MDSAGTDDPAAIRTNILTGLARLGTVLRARGWRQAEPGGMTATQAQILAYLVARGSARMGAVAEEIAVTQPTATGAVAALVRKGYVEKLRDPADGRATLLRPTAGGRGVAGGIAEWPDVLLAAVDALDGGEREVLLRALVKMIRELQQRGAIPVQRMCVSCRHFRPNAHAGTARPHHCTLVDAEFGDVMLRLDCGEHEQANAEVSGRRWTRFVAGDGGE